MLISAWLRRSLLTSLLLSPIVGFAAGEDPFVEPERTVTLPISNKFVNRIACDVPVDDYFWSEELPVLVSHEGSNVFVKLKSKQTGERVEYPTDPIDLQIVCAGAVYSMILQPRDMTTATIRLGAPQTKAIDATLKEYGALPFEDKIKKLTLAVYRDELPASFRRQPIASNYSMLKVPNDGTPQRLFENVVIRPVARVTAPGLGLAAIEYELAPSVEHMTFAERDFLLPQLSKSIAGITIYPLTLDPPLRKARLIIIERSVGAGNGS